MKSMMKMAPKKIRLCPSCPPKDLVLDTAPKFTFVSDKNETTKKITVVGNIKQKKSGLFKSLF